MLDWIIFTFTSVVIPVLILRHTSNPMRLFVAWMAGFLATIVTMAALMFLLEVGLGADPASVQRAIFGAGSWGLLIGPFIGMFVARRMRRRTNLSRRVRGTTRNEVSAGDPILKESADAYASRGPSSERLAANKSSRLQDKQELGSQEAISRVVHPVPTSPAPRSRPAGLPDTPIARKAYAEAIMIGDPAAQDFQRVVALLGPDADLEFVLQELREKYRSPRF